MKNTHLEHAEDIIIDGGIEVIEALFTENSHISVKIDGAPAIVWGTHPENGKWFVCTKAAFNKKKIRICYNKKDIDTHFGHQPNVAEILKACLKYLPKTDGVYQGDWMGFGGSDTFQPNLITYKFDEVISEDIVVAPHTYYTGKSLPKMNAHPLTGELISTKHCYFVQPIVDRIIDREFTIPVLNPKSLKFLSKKDTDIAKKSINALIKMGEGLPDEYLIDILHTPQLVNVYKLVMSIKHKVMSDLIVYNCPKAYINGESVNQEGFVISNEYGMIKLVNRFEFSYHNFTQGKFQK